MPQMRIIFTLIAGGALWAGSAWAQPPALTRSQPADGATSVPITIGALRFYFDQNMDPTSWTFAPAPGRELPPQEGAGHDPWLDSRCVQLRVGDLKSNTTYAVQLNTASTKGFHSANGDEPLPVTVVTFSTGAAIANPSPPATPVAQVPFRLGVTSVSFSSGSGSKNVRNPLGLDASGISNALPAQPPAPARKARNPLGADATAIPPSAEARRARSDRPACPAGWADFKNPLVGVQAYVPPDYCVRLRGGLMVTVERQDNPGTRAFIVPMRPRPGMTAAVIADRFARLAARAEPRFRAQLLRAPSAELACSRFSTFAAGQPLEGRYCAVLAAGRTMAYVIGIAAPEGHLEQARPRLEQIAQGLAFVPPRGKWTSYKSPTGGFTMSIPQGWQVETADGRGGKETTEWLAYDPARPSSRAFQWCPRYCSDPLQQDPLHAAHSPEAAKFPTHEQVVLASLLQLSQSPRLIKMNVNDELTQLLQVSNDQNAEWLASMNLARTDVTVYDCLAQAQVEGRPVQLAFSAGIQTLIRAGGTRKPSDLSVTLRGWCAEAGHALTDAPVLAQVCASMQLAPEFLHKPAKGHAEPATRVPGTYDSFGRVSESLWQTHWDLMEPVADMNYAALRNYGGYVNEKTGRIEQLSPEHLVSNSRGELVSAEEVSRGVRRDHATVLRAAGPDDYMRGIYGRITFSY
jgi:Bacterial Ig-like domain